MGALEQESAKKRKPMMLSIIFCAHLRFHTVGDTIDGALDFARPLAIVGEEALTLNEFEEKGVDPSLAAQIRTYIVSLVKE